MQKEHFFIKKHGLLGSLNEVIGRIGLYFAVILLVIMTLAVLLQIGSRAARMPIGWTEQLSVTAMVWITFLVAPYAYRRHLFAKIEIIFDHVSGRSHYLLMLILHILEFIILCFAIYYAWKFFEGARSKLPALSTLLRQIASPFVAEDMLYKIAFPAKWSYAIVPLSFFCMGLVAIEHIGRSLLSFIYGQDKTTLSFIDTVVTSDESEEYLLDKGGVE